MMTKVRATFMVKKVVAADGTREKLKLCRERGAFMQFSQIRIGQSRTGHVEIADAYTNFRHGNVNTYMPKCLLTMIVI